MSTPLTTEQKRLLAQSLPVVESHREALIAVLQTSLAAAEGPEEPFGQADVTALLLTQMLIDRGRTLARGLPLEGLEAELDDHRRQEIDGRHYSRFGDALVPALRDVLGPQVPADIYTAWCDAFWQVIREIMREPASLRE